MAKCRMQMRMRDSGEDFISGLFYFCFCFGAFVVPFFFVVLFFAGKEKSSLSRRRMIPEGGAKTVSTRRRLGFKRRVRETVKRSR